MKLTTALLLTAFAALTCAAPSPSKAVKPRYPSPSSYTHARIDGLDQPSEGEAVGRSEAKGDEIFADWGDGDLKKRAEADEDLVFVDWGQAVGERAESAQDIVLSYWGRK